MELTKGLHIKLPKNLNGLSPLPGGINPEDVKGMNVASEPTEGLIELEVTIKKDGPRGKDVRVISATQGIIQDLLKRMEEESMERENA